MDSNIFEPKARLQKHGNIDCNKVYNSYIFPNGDDIRT